MIESITLSLFVVVLSISAYFSRSLTKSGSFAAVFVGIAVSLGLGLKGLLIIGLFFVSSSFWSKFKSKKKEKVELRVEKGSQRDWQQVVANGGTAAIACILYFLYPSQLFLIGFLIAIASANSDTWASEIGSLSKQPPIHIRTLRRIAAGTSGAISLLGSFAAICGALIIAILAAFIFQLSILDTFIVFLFGFLGNVIDTLLGAYNQALYRCEICGDEVEKLAHCGTKTTLIRGKAFVNNDFVNFFSGFLATLLGMFILLVIYF